MVPNSYVVLLSQQLVENISTCLQQLEQHQPGSTARLFSEAMLQLSIADTPALQKLRAAATSLFGNLSSSSSVAHSRQSSVGGAPAGSHVRLSAQQLQQHQALPGAKEQPALGPLGDFLMARWREDSARAAAAAARQHA